MGPKRGPRRKAGAMTLEVAPQLAPGRPSKSRRPPAAGAPAPSEPRQPERETHGINDIMKRGNRLGGLLSSQSALPLLQPPPQLAVQASSRQRRHLRKFEEDEGFKFRRSQNGSAISTPVARLRDELAGLSDDEAVPMHFAPGRGVSESDSDDLRRLTSPIRPPGRSVLGQSSDDNDASFDDADYVDDARVRRAAKPVASQSKLKRRSSYHHRGKRLLSIGNGFMGVPHDDIPVSDYYKLLDSSLPEPHRMRQLLIWCFKKRLDQEEQAMRQANAKPSSTPVADKSVVYIAKVIKEEVLRDLIGGHIETSWYNRPHRDGPGVGAESSHTVKLHPNPLNVATQTNLELYRRKLNQIKHERREWERSYATHAAAASAAKAAFPAITLQDKEYKDPDGVAEMASTVAALPATIERSVDNISHTSYRLASGHQWIEHTKRGNMNRRLSAVVKEITAPGQTVSATPNATPEGGAAAGIWPEVRAPTTRELLRGIARLDARGA